MYRSQRSSVSGMVSVNSLSLNRRKPKTSSTIIPTGISGLSITSTRPVRIPLLVPAPRNIRRSTIVNRWPRKFARPATQSLAPGTLVSSADNIITSRISSRSTRNFSLASLKPIPTHSFESAPCAMPSPSARLLSHAAAQKACHVNPPDRSAHVHSSAIAASTAAASSPDSTGLTRYCVAPCRSPQIRSVSCPLALTITTGIFAVAEFFDNRRVA